MLPRKKRDGLHKAPAWRRRATFQLLLERDGNKCWLCGKAMLTDPNNKGKFPHSATIDHVVPLMNGGTNEYEGKSNGENIDSFAILGK